MLILVVASKLNGALGTKRINGAMGPKRMNVGHVTLGLTPTRPAHGHAHRALMGPSRLNPAQLLAFCARRIHIRRRGARPVSATLVTSPTVPRVVRRACPGHMPRSRGM